MSNYIVSDTSLGSVADAIRTKGGTSAPLEYPQGFIDAIDDIQTGGTPTIQSLTVTENGTYTAPSGVDGYSPVTVNVSGGDTPIPDDGKTRIWIHIAEDTPDNRLTFYLRFYANKANNTTVDWGDGVSETLGSTTSTNYSHKYPSDGDYIIVMTVNSGTISFEGDSTNRIYGTSANSNNYNRIRITRIIFGDNVKRIGSYACAFCYTLSSVTISDSVISIGDYAFQYCYKLTSIMIPDSVTVIGKQAFSTCYTLASITISDSVTNIGMNVFQNCYTLSSVTISDSVISIVDYAFYSCYSLMSITIPDSVTSIGQHAFNSCYGMSEYHFKPTTPPALASTNAFANIPSDCIIYVPQGSLSAYQSATNYGNIASRMQEEPA